MKFGWRVSDFPVDGSSTSAFVSQMAAGMDLAQGRFESAWVADHFIPWAGFQDPSTDTYECWTTLCYFAGRYSGLNFGSIVMSQSYRSPALLAKMGATLQALTGGRFILGLGAGWKQDEYLAYGYDFPSAAIRLQQLEESIKVVRLMWTQSKSNFQGQHYHINDAICEPKPQPMTPLLIGGGGRKVTLRLAAQYADMWNFPGGSLANYAELLGVLRQHCTQVGRDYDQIVKSWACECVAVGGSSAEALRMAQSSPFYNPDSCIVGTPDEVTKQLQRFTDLGVRHFILRFADFPRLEGMRYFADEVMPRFASLG